MTPEDLAYYNEVNEQAALDEIDSYEQELAEHENHVHVGDEVKDRLNESLKAAANPEEETPEEAARKDKFQRVPNRKMRRDILRLVGEVKSNRSRIRRRVYRVRRYYEAK
ncbi:hypothetical protein SEA_NANOSMITE_81 [Mycobacterium phage Nanosmite]|nr:hypothetical protein SEA_NANOSMITE_81 [Mycobacterium phage Nanosmite]